MNRLSELITLLKRQNLDAALIRGEANIAALTGIRCDNAVLLVDTANGEDGVVFHTDFRYTSMVHRVAPTMKVEDIRSLKIPASYRRIGFEGAISYTNYEKMRKLSSKDSSFVLIDEEIASLRAVKSEDEIARLRMSQALNMRIWREAKSLFHLGMSEMEMAKIIRMLANEYGEGEAFSTIVSVGANAAECHHMPDDTEMDRQASVLVDMGVRYQGVCSDMTRNIPPIRQSNLYRQVYDLVAEAHNAAIAAVRPGMLAKDVDAVARSIIEKGGYGSCFGHALGHGVGLEIHEAPTISKLGTMVLKPGMVFTIEPGIYIEGQLGVRIEDMVLVTENGCEVFAIK